jgi:3-deoxy-7-phosphoheptulonate synthase
MLVFLNPGSASVDAHRVLELGSGLGLRAELLEVADRVVVRLSGYSDPPGADLFDELPEVSLVLPGSRPPLRTGREGKSPEAGFRVGSTLIGAGGLTLIAGPCAVESEDQLVPLAQRLAQAGADLLRGGAYKPRSSPYDFQGLGEPGLRLLALARSEAGLPVVTEAVDEASLSLVEEYADVIQIGARNMHNYALLKRAGKSKRPVFLKRGMAAGLEDLLLAAEYVMDQGNGRVMLCERGIRTFSNHSRFTLDLAIVPRLKRLTQLPVFVDPSHASGVRDSVAPLARAAVAAGADGVMIEVHPDPVHALCDGHQSLRPDEFAALAGQLRALASLIDNRRETVS